ncbi:hypothetical protein GZ78_04515 [Endozoicomonas numazuensis]|uniref:Uncharacterized protein n=1 Tax=Endozoicomonas numazuensis TaxID=1137799 RepID=A0A081NLD2_9GAMM|nr:hypothetical protein GZ78_04515 [Endozoicomonas numazuensis]
MIGILVVILFSLTILLFLILTANAIHFYKKRYREISETIDGVFFDCGFLFATHRLMMWGHYCLFPKRAQRDNVLPVFENLSNPVRRQLKLHYLGLLTCCFLMIFSYLLSKYLLPGE